MEAVWNGLICKLHIILYVCLTLFNMVECQGLYSTSNRVRTERRLPQNGRYEERRWQSTSNNRGLPQYETYNTQNYARNNDQRVRDNRQIVQNSLNDYQSPRRYRQDIDQVDRPGRYRQQASTSRDQPMVQNNARPFRASKSKYKYDMPVSFNRYGRQMASRSGVHTPQRMGPAYLTQNANQRNLLNVAFQRDRDSGYHQIPNDSQMQRQTIAANNVYVGNDRRNLVNSRDQSYRSRGSRDNNVLNAPSRSRFQGVRNEFQYRPTIPSRANEAEEHVRNKDMARVNHGSLSVPIEGYGPLYAEMYNSRFRSAQYMGYRIPEAKTLPQGLVFAGKDYEARREASMGTPERQRVDSFISRESQVVPGMSARALGNILGISSQSITDIASTPLVFARTKESNRQAGYTSAGVNARVNNAPAVPLVLRNRNSEESNLLNNLDYALGKRTLEQKLDLYKELENDDDDGSDDYDVPVKVIIISDSDTFSELEADVASAGSYIGAPPPSSIDENLLNIASEIYEKPPTVRRRNTKQTEEKYSNTINSKQETKDAQTKTEDKVTVVTTYSTKTPKKSSEKVTVAVTNPYRRFSTPVRNINTGSDANDANDGFINRINDWRWR
ncbi:hypothetical protein ACF0H5_009008 [Mactra antiquata]